MILIYPEFNEYNALRLSKLLGINAFPILSRTFPNGEVLARIPRADEIKGNKVLLYFPTYPNTNVRLQLLYQSLEIINHYNAISIDLLIPYFPYSRQDKRFLKGESLSLKLQLEIFNALNVSKLITVNPHNEDALKKFSGDIEVIPMNLFHNLLEIVLRLVGDEKVFLVAPDMGRCEDVSLLAEKMGCKYLCLEKIRDRYTGEVTINIGVSINKNYRKAIVVDDEISTGGTISKASEVLKKQGVHDIYVAAVHLLLTGNALEKLSKSGALAIFGTNTVDNPFVVLNIEDKVAEFYKKDIHV